MKDYTEITKLQEAENKKIKSNVIFDNIIKDFSSILADVMNIKKEADELNQYGTSSLMDEYILEYTKIIWMLKQSMELKYKYVIYIINKYILEDIYDKND